jgi:tetratricopeptide (TPR) repeat protein
MLAHRSLAAILLLAALAAARAEAAPPREKERWIELSSPNFLFFSNAGARLTQQVASDLEELRAVLAHVTALELDSPLPILVYVFRDAQSFSPYRHHQAHQPVATAGYFLERAGASYIVIRADARDDASSIVYHEYVHFVASNNLAPLPLWFEEGLAELYQTFRVDGGKALIGLPVSRHLALLNSAPMLPLPELFAVGHGSAAYIDPAIKGRFYAQSWALVHYLLIGSAERRAETVRFIELLEQGMPPADASAAAYPIDDAALEKELRAYVRRLRFSYLELPVTIPPATAFARRELPYPELLYRLGDLLSQQSPPHPEAADYFLAAVGRESDPGPSLAALGRLAEDRASWHEARSWYRRALAVAPDDPRVQYLGGSYLLRRGGDAAEARQALRRAVRADRSYAPAWALLAGSFVAAGEYGDEAIEAGETAHRLLPARPDVTANLVRIYLGAGRRSAAAALAQQAFPADPAGEQMAVRMIARSDVDRARRLIADGQSDEAMVVLARAEATLRSVPDDKRVLQQIESLRSGVVDARLTQRYNQAVHSYNAGEVERARELLDALLREAPPGRHADAAGAFLAFLDDPTALAPPPAAESPIPAASPDEVGRLNQLLASGQLDQALRLLEELRSRSGPSPPLWIDLKIDEIRAVRADNRFVEAYNRAVGQFNGGAYAAAVATLEAALAEHPGAPDADAARELLSDARAALDRP